MVDSSSQKQIRLENKNFSNISTNEMSKDTTSKLEFKIHLTNKE